MKKLRPLILCGIFSLSLSSCAMFYKNPEPPFTPTMYVTFPGSCQVQNADNPKDLVTPQSPRWNELYCAPIDDLLALKFKIQKCKEWGE